MRSDDARARVGLLSREDASILGAGGRAAICAILSGRRIWLNVAALPGGVRAAARLVALGWCDLWGDDPASWSVTLSVRAADRLGVSPDEHIHITWRKDPADGARRQELEAVDRWVSVEHMRDHYSMPRARDVAGLPADFPAPYSAEGEPGEDRPSGRAAAPAMSAAERLAALGRFAGSICRPRSSKRTKPRPGRRAAG